MKNYKSGAVVAIGLIFATTPVSAQVVVAPAAPRPTPSPSPASAGTVVVTPPATSPQTQRRSTGGQVTVTPSQSSGSTGVVVTAPGDRRGNRGRGDASRAGSGSGEAVVVARGEDRGTTVRDFVPGSYGVVCPTRLIAGDRDFGGRPEIWIKASVALTRDNAVELTLYFRAKENKHDWTETDGTWKYRLTPPGMRVKSILSSAHSDLNLRFGPTVHLGDIGPTGGREFAPSTGSLVAGFQVIGDTHGDDVSTDANCRDDTGVKVRFNPLKLEVYN